MKRRVALIMGVSQAFLFLMSGCATTGKSVGLGAATGSGIGAGIGALADPGDHGDNRVRNVLIGSVVGGVVGAGSGYIVDRLVQDEKDATYQKGKKDAQQETSEHPFSSDTSQPKLIPARTEARWVSDQVRGSTFVPGHFEYVIIEGARWDSHK